MDFVRQQGVERRYSDDVIHEQIAEKWSDLPKSVRSYEPDDWYGPYVDDLGAHYDNQRLPGGYHASTEFEGGPVSVHRDAHCPEGTVIGTIAGGAIGAFYELGRQIGAGEPTNLGSILDSAAKGALIGGTIGLAIDLAVIWILGLGFVSVLEVVSATGEVLLTTTEIGSIFVLGGSALGFKLGLEKGEQQKKVLELKECKGQECDDPADHQDQSDYFDPPPAVLH